MSLHPNMIYDLAGELHVMIQHVDQGLAPQYMIQKYCSETKIRQQCRSITPHLHIVHSGILPPATDFVLTTSQQNHPVCLYNERGKYAHIKSIHFTRSYCLKM